MFWTVYAGIILYTVNLITINVCLFSTKQHCTIMKFRKYQQFEKTVVIKAFILRFWWGRLVGSSSYLQLSGSLSNRQQPCGFPLVTHCWHCFPPFPITPFLTHNPSWHNRTAYCVSPPQRSRGCPGYSLGLCSSSTPRRPLWKPQTNRV